jgi:hypothetical protein
MLVAVDFSFLIISEIVTLIYRHFKPLEATLKSQFSTSEIITNIRNCFNEGTYSNACRWRLSGFGGLEVSCWPLESMFAGSNPAETVGFFRAKKIFSTPSFGGELKRVSHVSDLRHVK